MFKQINKDNKNKGEEEKTRAVNGVVTTSLSLHHSSTRLWSSLSKGNCVRVW